MLSNRGLLWFLLSQPLGITHGQSYHGDNFLASRWRFMPPYSWQVLSVSFPTAHLLDPEPIDKSGFGSRLPTGRHRLTLAPVFAIKHIDIKTHVCCHRRIILSPSVSTLYLRVITQGHIQPTSIVKHSSLSIYLIHTYIHTYIYIHIYIHTHMHTYIPQSVLHIHSHI